MEEKSQLLFKVIVGIHAGAEIILPEGEYILGSGHEADIVLDDETVMPSHCRIVVSPDALKVIPLEGTVYVSGVEVPQEGTVVQMFQAVYTGRTVWSIGTPDGQWPEPEEVLALKQEHSSLPETTDEKDEVPQPQTDKTEVVEQGPVQKEKKKATPLMAVISILVLVVAGVFLFSALQQDTSVLMAESESNRIAAVKDFLRDLNNPSLEVTTERAGEIVVSGVVPTLKQRIDISRKIKNRFPDVIVRITSVQELNDALNDVIKGYGFKYVKGYVDQQGRAVLTGFVTDSVKLKRLLDSVREDIPALVAIETDLKVGTTVKKEIEEMLKEIEGGEVAVSVSERTIQIAGTVPAGVKDRVEELLRRIQKDYSDVFTIQTSISYREMTVDRKELQAPERLGIVIRGVFVGRTKYIVLDNGHRYFQGATLPNGYRLKEITPEVIYLARDGTIVKINTGGE